MKDKNIRFDDLEHIKREIGKLETKISDYVSDKNLQEIVDWAFEFSSREIKYHNLEAEYANVLHYVRRYSVLTQAYGMFYSANLEREEATELEFELPEYEEIDKLIRFQEQRHRKRLK